MTFRLKHLTFVGPGVRPTSASFADDLTVIYGASDTGKTFICDSIDYMLGASELRVIEESESYTHILLGVVLGSSETITLARRKDGGSFSLYRRDVRDIYDETRPPDVTLAERHSRSDFDNLSRYLLRELGLEDKQLRRNASNELVNLSFRNLVRFFLIDETSVLETTSPVFSGQRTEATTERSLFKLLVDDLDDSGLTPARTPTDRKVSRGKVEVLDEVIANLESSLAEATPTPSAVQEQVARLRATISSKSRAISSIIAERDRLAGQQRVVRQSIDNLRDQIGEIQELQGRFTLLLQQYETDLARLGMVEEAGSLLGYFDVGRCVFCGAEPADQNPSTHRLQEVTDLAESIEAETRHIGVLRDDLSATLEDIETRRARTSERLEELSAQFENIGRLVREQELLLEPEDSELTELLTLRTELERVIGIQEQIAQINEMRLGAEEETRARKASPPAEISSERLGRLSRAISDLLTEWGVPGGETAYFDREEHDVKIGSQLRSVRGKGMRSILHAAFTLALAQHSLEIGSGHPGVVILDSPLVTYRGPDGALVDRDESEEAVSDDVAARFFRSLRNIGIQVIVIENTDPPAEFMSAEASIYFSGNPFSTRPGFFPSIH